MEKQLSYDLTVSELLERRPQAAGVFLRHRMACVGCAIAPFETLSEVCEIYQLDLGKFMQELEEVSPSTSSSSL